MFRVMIVDDEPQVGKSLSRLLGRRYQVALCTTGEQALAEADRFHPDLVITDFRMPGMNGAELLAEIKSHHPRIQGLIISGYADVESAAGACAYPFVSKPWDNDVLLTLIGELLSGTRVDASTATAFLERPASAA